MTNYFIDFHALQTVPASNLNRDETGSPKSMTFGGVRRARVSSQAWKKAMRDYFVDNFDVHDSGLRTLEVPGLIAEEIIRQAKESDGTEISYAEAEQKAVEALKLAKIQFTKAKKGERQQVKALFFISRNQIKTIASIMLNDGLDEKERKEAVRNALRREHSVDMALFGRMVADDPYLNVDAACQVAHAIGVAPAVPEFDFYTAVDDHSVEDHAGGAMMGTIEYNSSTYYRYADVSLSQLQDNLGDTEAVKHAIAMFTKAFIESMPSGKQNTFAAQTLPSAVVVTVRAGRPVSYADAFVKPIRTGNDDAKAAEDAMVDYAEATASAFDLKPVASFVTYLGDSRVRELGEGCDETELVRKVSELAGSLVDATVLDEHAEA